jgi:hypothetical protein
VCKWIAQSAAGSKAPVIGFVSRRGKIFLGSNESSIYWVPGALSPEVKLYSPHPPCPHNTEISPGIKRPWLQIDQSSASTTPCLFLFIVTLTLEQRESVKRFVLLQFLSSRTVGRAPGTGISPSQGRYLHRIIQTQNKRIQTSLP